MNKFIYSCIFFLPILANAQYTGTASVTQGLATATTTNLYTCAGGRLAGIGTITASDKSVWTVPALVNYTNSAFPFSSDLYNSCNSKTYANTAAAVAALNGSDIVTIDKDGELITAFVFADNYFEMYINGTPVGKDVVPYTQFNSSIVRFRVKKPFTIAMLLVDWEEHLGLGAELNGGFQYHDGDGGMVALFRDTNNKAVAITDNKWKAQTFYTAPITDLKCPTENGSSRLSDQCSTADVNDGTSYYGLHWSRPAGWMNAGFRDSAWPNAITYSNATVGINNKPAYTNFTDVFDDTKNDAQFIWSSNLILDNEVIVRYTVPGGTANTLQNYPENNFHIYPNPADKTIYIALPEEINASQIQFTRIISATGKIIFNHNAFVQSIPVSEFETGIYFLQIQTNHSIITKKIRIQ